MAWVKAHVEIKPASIGTGIKVGLRRSIKSAAQMSFSISEAVAKRLGWSDGDKIEIMIGDGEHHGLIRLRKNNSVGQVAIQRRETAKGAWFSLKLGHQPAFVDRSEPAAWCQFEKNEDGWVELALPKWADETALRKPASPPVQPRPSAPQAQRRTVTALLMGDPEPGRREMLQKMGEIASGK